VQTARVLDIPVDCVDMEEAVAAIAAMVEAGGPTRLVATVNPEFVMRARRDPAFRAALEGAALRLPDGSGVVWAMRRQGLGQREPVTGIDLLPRLAQLCASRGWRPFLLGAREGVAAAAARRLVELAPGLEVAGAHSGSPRLEDDEESLRLIRATRPQLLLVAYGAPHQELWVVRNASRLEVPVAIGVGGAFDFLAGRIRRAPLALRRVHLEWLWRLARQPWRARRMAVLPLFAAEVLRGRPPRWLS
jgi:N-acetylglucosaminyldiphosphoundecaprenol N-acetyl-beta-D-mannosaminyltransferase